MTDSQRLLAEYVQTGSDAAFRELITRYVGLVYSTACRLVDRDTHRAEDVAQIVFVDRAQKRPDSFRTRCAAGSKVPAWSAAAPRRPVFEMQ
jgi:DNA-directed RNA polymerase specialized sigma24 family protein